MVETTMLNLNTRSKILVIIGLLVALIDETIQLFPVCRSSSVKDVWLDFSGVIFGTIILLVLRQIYLFKLRKTLK